MLAYQDNTATNDTVDTAVGGDYMADQSKLNAYGGQDDGYTRVPKPGMPTYTEAWALIEAARRMAIASDYASQDNIKDRNKVRDAIRLNWRLWTIFQAEMSVDDQGAVPDEIRVNMLTLCKFVDQHTVETLKDPAPERISTLIEINRNIAAGLLESLKQLEAESGATQPEQESAEPEQNLTSIATSV